jgi:hypothetical protein
VSANLANVDLRLTDPCQCIAIVMSVSAESS